MNIRSCGYKTPTYDRKFVVIRVVYHLHDLASMVGPIVCDSKSKVWLGIDDSVSNRGTTIVP